MDEHTTNAMEEQIIVDSDQVVNPTEIISKEEESQPMTIIKDIQTSIDDNKVVDPCEIKENGECKQTSITMDELTSITMDEYMGLNSDPHDNLSKEEKEEESEPIITNNSITIDDIIAIDEILSKEEKEEESEPIIDNHSPPKATFWSMPCYSSPNCPGGLFLVALPVVMLLVGIVYTRNGYVNGIEYYNCDAQPLLPVLLLVWGFVLVFNVLVGQFHKHIDARIYVYAVIYGISPVLLLVCTVMVIRVIPPVIDDSSEKGYCPPFLYYLLFTCCTIGIFFYSCVIWFLWCASKLMGG